MNATLANHSEGEVLLSGWTYEPRRMFIDKVVEDLHHVRASQNRYRLKELHLSHSFPYCLDALKVFPSISS